MDATEDHSVLFRAKLNLETAQIQRWVEAGKLGKITDVQAAAWFDSDALVWAVVVSPWVLVQSVGKLQ